MLGARAGRARPGRHQAGARLLDGQPARLHARPRSPSGRPRAAAVPPAHPRRVQGAAVPRRRRGHPRRRHQPDGRDMGGLRRRDAGDVRDDDDRSRRARRASRRSPASSPRRRCSARPRRRRCTTARSPPWAGWLVLVVGLLTVAVTAAYATRLWLLTFFVRPPVGRSPAPHDAVAAMRWPLVAARGADRRCSARSSGCADARGCRRGSTPPCRLHPPRPTQHGLGIGRRRRAGLAAARRRRCVRVWRRAGAPTRARPVAGRCAGAACWRTAFYVDHALRPAVRPAGRASLRARCVAGDRDVVDATCDGLRPRGDRAGRLLRAAAGRQRARRYLTGLLAGVVLARRRGGERST